MAVVAGSAMCFLVVGGWEGEGRVCVVRNTWQHHGRTTYTTLPRTHWHSSEQLMKHACLGWSWPRAWKCVHSPTIS